MGHNRNLADYAHHFDGTNIDLGSGNIETEGVVTYEDVTNVDAIGIVTARAGVKVPDNQKVLLGTGDDLEIFHDGTNTHISNSTGGLFINQYLDDGDIFLRTDDGSGGFTNYLSCDGSEGEVKLYHYGNEKLKTSSTGATVTGTLVSDSVTSELDLSAISSSISDTAVDVFVYDTRKDSDGGAWRKRTQNTSWYNETLNTATRGSRKEFPAVAVIVIERQKIRIYDGDDPDLPMWMVFEINQYTNGGNLAYTPFGIGHVASPPFNSVSLSSVHMLNGLLFIGGNRDTNSNSVHAGYDINFISEVMHEYMHYPVSATRTSKWKLYGNISQRNSTDVVQYPSSRYRATGTDGGFSNVVNDVTMTVLPNAPIDDITGLPVPTIAVGTDGSLSVITDSGSVFDDTTSAGVSSAGVEGCAFSGTKVVYYRGGASGNKAYVQDVFGISADFTGQRMYRFSPYGETNEVTDVCHGFADIDAVEGSDDNLILGAEEGIAIINENLESPTRGLVAKIASDYNTGWMPGKVKGAFLSDTDDTNAIEYVQNGYFNSDVSNWTIGSTGTTASLDANRLLLTAPSSGSSWGYVYQGVTTEIGKTYKVSLKYDLGSANGRINVRNDSSNTVAGALFYADLGTNEDGKTYFNTFTATATTTYILLYAKSTSGGTSAYDEVSVTLEKDRSVNNKGLQVFGTVTKSAVATGADLVSYGPFTTSNRLRQPYNSDLNFGTNDFSIILWMYNTGSTVHQTLVGRDNREFSVDILDNANYDRKFRIYAFNSSNSMGSFDSNADPFPLNTWTHVCVNYTGGDTVAVYVNGVLNKSGTLNYDIDDTSNRLNIGCRNTSGSYAHAADATKLALVRISKSAPSPEQIKKMYEDEKHLFQENAKATLYGSSDAVTALGYDEDTELLHVGTSAGRSDFQGLRRINNTTTAVTTAISASDELIAEQ